MFPMFAVGSWFIPRPETYTLAVSGTFTVILHFDVSVDWLMYLCLTVELDACDWFCVSQIMPCSDVRGENLPVDYGCLLFQASTVKN